MRIAAALAVAAAFLAAAAGAARADVAVDVGFGFDGVVVPGYVQPVRVVLASTEKTAITVTVELAASGDGAGVALDGLVHRVQVYLAPGAKRRLTIPVVSRGSSTGEEWALTVRTPRRTLLRQGTRFEDGRSLRIDLGALAGVTTNPGNVDPNAPILGVLGDPGNRLGWLGTITDEEQRRKEAGRVPSGGLALEPRGGRKTAIPGVLAISPESAPDTWIAYEGFDAVIWVDPDPASMPDPAQVDALLEWALNGGRLVVALTPAARIPAGSALARALPAEGLGFDDVPSDRLLTSLAGSSKGVRAGNVPVARLGPLQGRVVKADAEGRTLVAKRDTGLGTVTVLAFDPRLLSGAAPAPRGELLRLVMGPLVLLQSDESEPQFYGASLERLEDHLRRRFVRTPPLLVLVLGLALYVLAIGPVDYLVLKKRNKLRRTVVTFPLIVIGFTVAAYGASFLLFGAAGGQARVAILDFATTPGRDADAVRGLDFLGTYSPVGRTLEVRWPAPRSFVSGPWASPAGWQWGMGGGMAGSLAGSVEFSPDGRPSATVDIPLRSYRTIQARFSGEVASSLDADILVRDGQRILRATNRLKRRVRDLWAVEPGTGGTFTARRLGDLEAGGTAEYVLAQIPGSVVGQTPMLPDPFQEGGGGLYARNTGGWGGDGDAFVPMDSSAAAQDRAREAVAKGLLGASVGGLRSRAETRSVRSVARQGLDISRGVREGRVLLMGWCDGDPVGDLLPDDGDLRSTVVAVRRLLPAEEAR